jgi:hypothetical protein
LSPSESDFLFFYLIVFHSACSPSKTKSDIVCSLPEGKDDRALEAAVTREFSRFGTVFVKIRREGRGNVMGMPYAFAQYTVSSLDIAKAA